MAECAREFGWPTNVTLKTPARTVFAVLRAAKQLKTREHAEHMYDLVGAVCTASGDDKYIKAVRKMWVDIRDDAVPEFKAVKVRYEDGTPVIPWKQASHLMAQQMAVMMKVNHG